MISETVFNLTHGNDTITSVVAANPERAPGAVAVELFKTSVKESSSGFLRALKTSIGLKDQTRVAAHIDPTPDDLDRAAQCGRFPVRPSALFLKVIWLEMAALQGADLYSHLDLSQCTTDIGGRSDGGGRLPTFDGFIWRRTSHYRLSVSTTQSRMCPSRSLHDANTPFLIASKIS